MDHARCWKEDRARYGIAATSRSRSIRKPVKRVLMQRRQDQRPELALPRRPPSRCSLAHDVAPAYAAQPSQAPRCRTGCVQRDVAVPPAPDVHSSVFPSGQTIAHAWRVSRSHPRPPALRGSCSPRPKLPVGTGVPREHSARLRAALPRARPPHHASGQPARDAAPMPHDCQSSLLAGASVRRHCQPGTSVSPSFVDITKRSAAASLDKDRARRTRHIFRSGPLTLQTLFTLTEWKGSSFLLSVFTFWFTSPLTVGRSASRRCRSRTTQRRSR